MEKEPIPGFYMGDQYPIDEVRWTDCQKFISKLNQITGKNFRLPTVAEWEYAARGGSKSRGYQYSGSNNLSDVAWYRANSNNTMHPVGTKQANELGIYDMSGNVWEWCLLPMGKYPHKPQKDPIGKNNGILLNSEVETGTVILKTVGHLTVNFLVMGTLLMALALG